MPTNHSKIQVLLNLIPPDFTYAAGRCRNFTMLIYLILFKMFIFRFDNYKPKILRLNPFCSK